MCGIFGYIGTRNCKEILLSGLKKVEYRGYDSAGISLFDINANAIQTVKASGKILNLEKKLYANKNIAGSVGIAHTRWATHGEPTEKNAHPHYSNDKKIFLVHNGIIENYSSLRKELLRKGYSFYSETDTEVLVNLIQYLYKGSIEEAVREALNQVTGTYGIGVMHVDHPETLIAARQGSPLIVGVGKNENYFASDVASLINLTKDVIYLADKEMAIVNKDRIEHKTINAETVDREVEKVEHSIENIEKNGYEHFMLKEIFEQPKTIKDSTRGRLLLEEATSKLGGLSSHPDTFKKLINAKKIYIVACGTSWHSALIGEYMLEEYAKISVEVEYASEFRYRDPIIEPNTVVIAISQSGETADTLAAIREANRKGATTIGICNVVGSTISKETDAGVYLHVGPEIGVASTKAFTSQVVILALITLDIARRKNLSYDQGYEIVRELKILPTLIEEILKNAKQIQDIAKEISKSANALYLGRGYSYPVALEGALKLKEISYIHAEGYPAAEMKHGPIALIDENMPVICIATNDSIYDKVISNIIEVKARKGKVIAIANYGDTTIEDHSDFVIKIPSTINLLNPVLAVIPLQLLSYYVAVMRGCDVDQPRNLAKSVTVE